MLFKSCDSRSVIFQMTSDAVVPEVVPLTVVLVCDVNEIPDRLLLLFRIGALFFIVVNQCFGSLSAAELFITERKIFVWVLHTNTQEL